MVELRNVKIGTIEPEFQLSIKYQILLLVNNRFGTYIDYLHSYSII